METFLWIIGIIILAYILRRFEDKCDEYKIELCDIHPECSYAENGERIKLAKIFMFGGFKLWWDKFEYSELWKILFWGGLIVIIAYNIYKYL